MTRKILLLSTLFVTAFFALPSESFGSSPSTSVTTTTQDWRYRQERRRYSRRYRDVYGNRTWGRTYGRTYGRYRNTYGYRNYGQYRRTQVGNRRYRTVTRYYWDDGRRRTRLVRLYY